MRKIFVIPFLFPLLLACNNQDRKPNADNDSSVEILKPVDSISGDSQGKVLEESATEKDGTASDSPVGTEKKPAPSGLEGEYRRVDSEGNTGPCDCSCIDVSFDRPTELCISPENIYITARFKNTGNTSAEIYFENKVQSDALAENIPWSDFDNNIPIATIKIQPDNSLKLDWIGFSIKGELAVDYIIYGKKTLEGNYIRQ